MVERLHSAPRLSLLWLAGIDLRVTILALPPVLPIIHHDLALSEKAVAALTGLPVLVFGILAIPGALLIARVGARRALLAGLMMVAAGSALRGLGPSVPMLFAMTLIMGAGVAVMQPALPSLVSDWFPSRAGFATAVYANGLLVGETLSAALTLPLVLPLVGGSWPLSFVVWSAPALLTAVLIGALTPHAAHPGDQRARLWWPDPRDPDTWRAGLILGGGSAIYFGSNAFIPDFLWATGRPELVGPCLSALNLSQFPASFLILLFARQTVGRRGPIFAVGLIALAALGLCLLPQDWAIILAAGILGFCGAFVLIASLALPPLLAGRAEVPRLSAGMFSIGYLTAFVLPLISGLAWDATGSPLAAFLPVVTGAALVLGVVSSLRPNKTANAG